MCVWRHPHPTRYHEVDDEITVDEATQDQRNGVCCRSENAATSIGVVSVNGH